MLVKLDCFHWQKRWDAALSDLRSEKTTIFRSMMRRAAFQVEDQEHSRIKDLLVSKGKPHLPADVLKVAKATTPPPKLLERRVMAIVHAVMEKDLETDRQRTQSQEKERPESRFFKPGAETINVTIRQLSHVKKDCLSDPPAALLEVHRHNVATGKTHSARGTGGNEVAWRHVHRPLDTPSIGVTRAEQAIHNCFESDNNKKRVTRLGERPEETSRSEQLQSLTRLAVKCGFHATEMPSTDVSCPSETNGLTEHIGMDHKLPFHCDVDDVQEEAEDDHSEGSDTDGLAEFLKDLDLENDVDTGNNNNADGLQETLDAEECDPVDVFALNQDIDMAIFVPTLAENEKTCDRFAHLTEQQPWVPFKHPKESATFSNVDRDEEALFKEMHGNCDRYQQKLDHATGHKSFARAWNFQVSALFKEQLEGNEVTPVNRKSYKQLQDCYDLLQRIKELQSLANKTDPHMQRLENELRATRTRTPHQFACNCQPINCNTNLGRPQFGAPCALNTEIAANAFQHNNPMTNGEAPITFRVPQSTV